MIDTPIMGELIKTATVEQLFERDKYGANSLQYAISYMNVHDALMIIRKEGITSQFLLQGDLQGDNSLDYAVSKLNYEVDKDAKNQPVNQDAEKIVMAIGRITGVDAFNKYMPGEVMYNPSVVKIAGKLKNEISRANMSVIPGSEDKPDIEGSIPSADPAKKKLRLIK